MWRVRPGFVQRALRALGVDRVHFRDAPQVRDIAVELAPGRTPRILLGRRFWRSGPAVQEQKIAHELLHVAGMEHAAAERAAGYASDPRRDRFSRAVARAIGGEGLVKYREFIRRGMREARPKSPTEARAALTRLAAEWRTGRQSSRQRNPHDDGDQVVLMYRGEPVVIQDGDGQAGVVVLHNPKGRRRRR